MRPERGRWRFEGHAIVSADERIADSDGRMPASLRNEADWAYFQRHLDEAAVVVTGRLGHEAHPNKPGRRRLVFTSRTPDGGFRREGDVAFLDPSRAPLADALAAFSSPGIVAVTGGTAVFDWFAERSLFDAFHLARARQALIPGGRPLFSGGPAEAALAAGGLRLAETVALDPAAGVVLDIYRSVAALGG
jgi:dihydrofolate reductase